MIIPRLLRAFVSFLLFVCSLSAAHRQAIIVVGLTSNETQAARLNAQARQLRDALEKRGLSTDAIQTLSANGAPLRRENILAALQKTPASTQETWLILLGTVAPTRDGEPAFQISGPRLGAADLSSSLAAIPGQKFVIAATSAGGGLLTPLLNIPSVEAVSATAPSGEINEPHFATHWAEALTAKPDASFAELAADTTARVQTFYKESKLAQSEHAHQLDRAKQAVVEIPVPSQSSSNAKGRFDDRAPTPPASSASIIISKPSGGLEFENLPATPETLALLASAKTRAASIDDNALILSSHAELTVSTDFTSSERWSVRTYLRSAEAIDDIATHALPQNSLFVSSSIDAARVIRPDGSQLLIDPRPLASKASAARNNEDDQKNQRPPIVPPFLELPEVTVGCIVEVAFSIERRPRNDTPEFYDEWSLAKKFPTLAASIQLTLPVGERWRFHAPGLPSPVQSASSANDKTRVLTWSLTDIPAFSLQSGDASVREITPWIGVSSLVSWEAFASWYRQLAAGSDATGPGVKALADDIRKNHPDRLSRLRAAYERVAALRYVAIELGVGAIRARTPEQVWAQRYGDCKDKASLLVAVLRELGIAADFALINRFGTTFTEFPGWQFNHALTHVPAAPAEGQQHALWLDTTDRLIPFGTIAPGDANRPSFILPSDGGPARFATVSAAQETPAVWRESWDLTAPAPGKNRTGSVTLSGDGYAEATLRRIFAEATPAGRIRRLHQILDVPTLTLTQLTTTDAYDLTVPFRIKATIELPQAAAIAPRPPELFDAFASATRTRALTLHEGRAFRYLQEIRSPGFSENTRSQQFRSEGFVFNETYPRGARVLDISTPAGPLDASKYAAVRLSWHTFLSQLTPLP